jgi:hypothetical protein
LTFNKKFAIIIIENKTKEVVIKMKNNFIKWFFQLPPEKRTKGKLLACYIKGFCTIAQYKICLKYTIDNSK